MCLARSTPHTGGSGAQGLWSVIHSQTTSEPLPKGGGPAKARKARRHRGKNPPAEPSQREMEFEIRARRAVSSDTLIETLSSFIAEKTPQPFGSPKKEAREGTQGYTGVPTVRPACCPVYLVLTVSCSLGERGC